MQTDLHNLSFELHDFCVGLLPHFREPDGEEEMAEKRDGTLVGRADLAIHQAFLNLTGRKFDFPVISEEAAHAWPPASPDFWLADPFDGTHNRKMRLPLTGCMFTLVRDGNPSFTAIFDAALELLYGDGFHFAGLAQGAWRWRRNGIRPLAVSRNAELGKANLLLEGSSKKLFADIRVKNLVRNAARTRIDLGCAVAFPRLAQGAVDLVVGLDNKPSDNLHGILLTEEAGGSVTDFEGKPPSLENCRDLLFSNDALHDAALRKMLCPVP